MTEYARLREPFPESQVGKLPRITCRDCSDSSSKVCSKHSKAKCGDCGNWITTKHIHLDYVGHGAVTDRLLEVDERWSWEPLASDEHGLPLFVRDSKGPVALWIRLTVGDITRLGVGSCPSGQFEAEKVLIGDALRNAAMRFGVALDLWVKGHGEDDEQATATSVRPSINEEDVAHLKQRLKDLPDYIQADVKQVVKDAGRRIEELTPDQLDEAHAFVTAVEEEIGEESPV